MANVIESRATKGKIETVSVAIKYDGSTAGGAMVSDVEIPADAVLDSIYINTNNGGAVLAGTGALRVAVGGAAQWVTAAIAAANVKASVLVPSNQHTGLIHVTASGTVSTANGVHIVTIAYIRGNG
ncbi:MAG: hypothetical protein Unbinned838contig1000_19 [Prokaryotic dsDNA virus sp.]|nr:MAG: hypothetical protein Unbinned838contig1000_19 [Prokaryotic dsDNA virus sp.]|tara:strand:+ start:19677 stop:20054 length:378 start_codon:yes stop_codon:yes gene_type:complete